MKAINRRLRRLDAHFAPTGRRPQYLTVWVGTHQHRVGLEYAFYKPPAGPGPILTEMITLNSLTLPWLSEEERKAWLEKQRASKPPGTPVPDSPWANWNKMREDGSVEFRGIATDNTTYHSGFCSRNAKIIAIPQGLLVWRAGSQVRGFGFAA